jgi:hypothetical protein
MKYLLLAVLLLAGCGKENPKWAAPMVNYHNPRTGEAMYCTTWSTDSAGKACCLGLCD